MGRFCRKYKKNLWQKHLINELPNLFIMMAPELNSKQPIKLSQFLLLNLFLLDVYIIVCSQCELTNIWSRKNIELFFV